MITNFLTRYAVLGALGWCMEVLWTGLCSLRRKDLSLRASTSLWMFFIYGLAVFILPVYGIISAYPFVIRGAIYTVCIFAMEFISGACLTRLSVCPWSYEGERLAVCGLIRLDYAPLWFIVGLIFERINIYLARF